MLCYKFNYIPSISYHMCMCVIMKLEINLFYLFAPQYLSTLGNHQMEQDV